LSTFTFNIKRVQVPLFRYVESTNQEKWRAAFEAGTTITPVELDDSALDIISSDLQLDADALAIDAERYATGLYRDKSKGLSGGRLGDFGEVLSYLIYKHEKSQLVRVIGSKLPGKLKAGDKYPKPDFLVLDPNGDPLSALEVKSREAFDYQFLNGCHWGFLQPCAQVKACRAESLRQLAYKKVGKKKVGQKHQLIHSGGTVVPFPVGKGIAAAVLAVDGRVNKLRIDPKLKTPPLCVKQNRDCWSCLPQDQHMVLVTMENEPGKLMLAGEGSDSGDWLRAYERWAQAVTYSDLIATRETLNTLIETTMPWLQTRQRSARQRLRRFWVEDLTEVMRSRGLGLDARGLYGDGGSPDFDFEPAREPYAREFSEDGLRGLIGDPVGDNRVPFLGSFLARGRDGRNSITIEGDRDSLEFRLISDNWRRRRPVANEREASELALFLINCALTANGYSELLPGWNVPLREISARVNEEKILLGWEVTGFWYGPAWAAVFTQSPYRPWPSWPAMLAIGHPSVRLLVRPDGRATFRFPRGLYEATDAA
jgi:hypothetical protein